jgi:hypothetical protein
MDRFVFIKNWEKISVLMDLYTWGFPLYFDRIPGQYGWTYRMGLFCLFFHLRTDSWRKRGEEDEMRARQELEEEYRPGSIYDPEEYDYDYEDIPF